MPRIFSIAPRNLICVPRLTKISGQNFINYETCVKYPAVSLIVIIINEILFNARDVLAKAKVRILLCAAKHFHQTFHDWNRTANESHFDVPEATIPPCYLYTGTFTITLGIPRAVIGLNAINRFVVRSLLTDSDIIKG